MTEEREQVRIASYLVLMKGESVLMMRRANTGWADGQYSLPAGHVDPGETAREACAREALEEVGLAVRVEDLALVHVMHRHDAHDYVDFYFKTEEWSGGEARIMEPHKADDIRWCAVHALPDDVVDPVRQALAEILKNITYSEHGWTSHLGSSDY